MSFFPVVITERNSFDMKISNSFSFNVFKKELLKLAIQEPNLS